MPKNDVTVVPARELEPLAKEINHRFEQAERWYKKADEHRLAAAIALKDAQERCKIDKVPFKEWVAANIKRSYTECVRLTSVARADNPLLALEDLRTGERRRQAKSRAKLKAKAALADLPKGPSGEQRRPESLYQLAHDALAQLPDDQVPELLKQRAERVGLAVLPKERIDKIRKEAREANECVDAGATVKNVMELFTRLRPAHRVSFIEELVTKHGIAIDHVEVAFKKLRPQERVEFAKWAGHEIGAKVEMPDFSKPASVDEALEVPEFLKR